MILVAEFVEYEIISPDDLMDNILSTFSNRYNCQDFDGVYYTAYVWCWPENVDVVKSLLSLYRSQIVLPGALPGLQRVIYYITEFHHLSRENFVQILQLFLS